MSIPSGSLDKLKIMGFKDATLKKPIASPPFIASINPASISLSYPTDLIPEKNATGASSEVKLGVVKPPTISFDLILDGTGALNNPVISNPAAVQLQVELFKTVCYYYIGEKHETPYVQLQWGTALMNYNSALFAARIQSLDISYSLFSPMGIPLRAKISAKFLGTMDSLKSFTIKKFSSPDLTHLVTIKAGDTLPMLCNEIYQNPNMYHQVAKINKLTNFRKLIPGQQLEFPPIKKI